MRSLQVAFDPSAKRERIVENTGGGMHMLWIRRVMCGVTLLWVTGMGVYGQDTTVYNAAFDYHVTFPSHDWRVVEMSDSQHYFIDTTDTYPGLCAIVREPVDGQDASAWTRSHFVAYRLSVQYSAAPWGFCLYWDSLYSYQPVQGGDDSLWAPAAFTEWYAADTAAGAWDEYIRYCANHQYGYELYALADTMDMNVHIGVYTAILKSVTLPPRTNAIRDPGVQRTRVRCCGSPSPLSPQGVFTVLGRYRDGMRAAARGADNVYIYRKKKILPYEYTADR
jgi:hypothetical protein